MLEAEKIISVPEEKSCFLLLQERGQKFGLSTKAERWQEGNQQGVCYHVRGPRSGQPLERESSYFSVVMAIPQLFLGIWTRKSRNKGIKPSAVIKPSNIFKLNTFNEWLDTWFDKAALKGLSRPSKS